MSSRAGVAHETIDHRGQRGTWAASRQRIAICRIPGRPAHERGRCQGGPGHHTIRGAHPRPWPAGWGRPVDRARTPAPARPNSHSDTHRARRCPRPDQGPAQRGRRLSGETLCLRGVGRAPGSAPTASGPAAWKVAAARQRGFRYGKPAGIIDENPHILSARETAVLELLMRRKGNVVSKKLVEDQIFGLAGDVSSNAVEVYVHRLRKQLMDGGAKVKISTVRGVGYIMTEDN